MIIPVRVKSDDNKDSFAVRLYLQQITHDRKYTIDFVHGDMQSECLNGQISSHWHVYVYIYTISYIVTGNFF